MLVEPNEMNVLDLVNADILLTTKDTVEKIEEVLR